MEILNVFKIGQISLRTADVAALEPLKTSTYTFIWKLVYVLLLRFFSCKETGQTQCLNLFEIRPGLTTDYGVSCH